MKRVLLVCASDCDELAERLVRAGCCTTRVNNGAEAILRAKHEPIDTVLLVSTGKDMDAAETALNLSDINSSLEIIIVVERKHGEQQTAQVGAIQSAIPHTRMLTVQELSRYLAGAKSGEAAARTKT
jgi:PleD family two-component response regulator